MNVHSPGHDHCVQFPDQRCPLYHSHRELNGVNARARDDLASAHGGSNVSLEGVQVPERKLGEAAAAAWVEVYTSNSESKRAALSRSMDMRDGCPLQSIV